MPLMFDACFFLAFARKRDIRERGKTCDTIERLRVIVIDAHTSYKIAVTTTRAR